MALPVPDDTLRPKGMLKITKDNEAGLFTITFTPPKAALPEEKGNPQSFEKIVAIVSNDIPILTIYPYKVWGTEPMKKRYQKLEEITFELPKYFECPEHLLDMDELLSDLPGAFTKDYNYGLGFLQEFRHIPNFLEEIGTTHLYIARTAKSYFKRDIGFFLINLRDFQKIVKAINTITIRARKLALSAKKDRVAEIIASIASGEKDKVSVAIRENTLDVLTYSMLNPPGEATKAKQNEAIKVISENSKKIIKAQPEKISKLRNDLELVTLEELISQFEKMLSKDLPESHWQRLLEENPFILSMAFGVPIVTIQGHASVGGRKLSGSGDKIADFLVKNSISHNALIIEIKKPSTKLINETSYRNNVYGPSSDITSAINQTLDQIYHLQSEVAALKHKSGISDLETYSVTGVVIAGKSMERKQQQSFEYFRGNSKNVQVITFDELLFKLKQLHSFLLPTAMLDKEPDDLPF